MSGRARTVNAQSHAPGMYETYGEISMKRSKGASPLASWQRGMSRALVFGR